MNVVTNKESRYIGGIASVVLVYLTTPLLNSGVEVIIPTLIKTFDVNLVLASWISAVFIISSASTILPAGRLADNYGRKRIFMIGISVLAVGAIIGGTAQSFWQLLLGRMIQGLGGGLQFSAGMAFIISMISKRHRAMFIGMISASVYIGLSVGPMVGGLIESLWGWRANFLIMVPICVVALLPVLFLKQDWRSEEKVDIDVAGSFVLAFATLSVVLAVTFVRHALSIYLWLSFAVFLTVFIVLQRKRSSPLIRFDLLIKNHTLSKSLVTSMIMYAGNYTIPLMTSLYSQFVWGFTAFEAGQVMIWQAAAMTSSAILSGYFNKRYSTKYVAGSGVLLFSIGLLTMAQILPLGELTYIKGCLIAVGFGFGLFSPSNSTIGLSNVADGRVGIGSGLLNYARVIGNILGTTIVIGLTALLIGQTVVTQENTSSFILLVQTVFMIGGCVAWIALGIILSQPKSLSE